MQKQTKRKEMSCLGIGLFVFGALRLAVSFINWLSRPYLPVYRRSKTENKSVSVLIPARNEEKNIGNLLSDLLEIENEMHEIIIYDDLSTDYTADIVRQFVRKSKKIKLLDGQPKPFGWLGKNHACHCLSLAATGDYFLFIDADVRVGAKTIVKALTYTQEKKLSLLSVFPEQLMPNMGTRLVVPLMNWILLSLLPIITVRLSPFVSMSAANGQFMFFEALTYREREPHSKFRLSAVEDMTIVRAYKGDGLRIATLLGNKDVKCTMYENMEEAVNGFSKNVFEFFGGSRIACCLFAATTTAAPFFIFLINGMKWGLIYLMILLSIRFFVSKASRQSALWNILLIIPQQFILWKIILTASARKKQKDLKWKGRNIYSDL